MRTEGYDLSGQSDSMRHRQLGRESSRSHPNEKRQAWHAPSKMRRMTTKEEKKAEESNVERLSLLLALP
jgi:hypothetical protein